MIQYIGNVFIDDVKPIPNRDRNSQSWSVSINKEIRAILNRNEPPQIGWYSFIKIEWRRYNKAFVKEIGYWTVSPEERKQKIEQENLKRLVEFQKNGKNNWKKP